MRRDSSARRSDRHRTITAPAETVSASRTPARCFSGFRMCSLPRSTWVRVRQPRMSPARTNCLAGNVLALLGTALTCAVAPSHGTACTSEMVGLPACVFVSPERVSADGRSAVAVQSRSPKTPYCHPSLDDPKVEQLLSLWQQHIDREQRRILDGARPYLTRSGATGHEHSSGHRAGPEATCALVVSGVVLVQGLFDVSRPGGVATSWRRTGRRGGARGGSAGAVRQGERGPTWSRAALERSAS